MTRDAFNLDWAFGIVGALKANVEENHRSLLARWPLLSTFQCTVYQLTPRYRLFVFEDRGPSSGVPTISSGNSALPLPDNVTPPRLDATTMEVYARWSTIVSELAVDPRNAAFVIRETDGLSNEDDWTNHYDELEKRFFSWQLERAIERNLQWIHGLDQIGNFVLPSGYEFLAPQCQAFFRDHPNYEKNVFLMTRFDSASPVLVQLDVELRRVLRSFGLDPVRADDKMFIPDRTLWHNVCVYMLCCGKGIAILEDRAADEFNPNVALEYGFMRALNRPTLLLADVGFRNLRADVIGTLRESFDLFDIRGTVEPAVSRWTASLGIVPEVPPPLENVPHASNPEPPPNPVGKEC